MTLHLLLGKMEQHKPDLLSCQKQEKEDKIYQTMILRYQRVGNAVMWSQRDGKCMKWALTLHRLTALREAPGLPVGRRDPETLWFEEIKLRSQGFQNLQDRILRRELHGERTPGICGGSLSGTQLSDDHYVL